MDLYPITSQEDLEEGQDGVSDDAAEKADADDDDDSDEDEEDLDM